MADAATCTRCRDHAVRLLLGQGAMADVIYSVVVRHESLAGNAVMCLLSICKTIILENLRGVKLRSRLATGARAGRRFALAHPSPLWHYWPGPGLCS